MNLFLVSFNDSTVDPTVASSDPEAYTKECRRIRRDHARIEKRLTEVIGTGRRFFRRVHVPTPRMGPPERAMWERMEQADLQRLRAYAAHIEFEGGPPEDLTLEDGSETANEILESIYRGELRSQQFTHLIHHADESGYYVPIEFTHPLEEEDLSVGSLQLLSRELVQLKEPLGNPALWGEVPDNAVPWAEGFEDRAVEVRTWSVLSWFVREALHKQLSMEFGP